MSMNTDETQPIQVPDPKLKQEKEQKENGVDATMPVPVGSISKTEETLPVQVENVEDRSMPDEAPQTLLSIQEGGDGGNTAKPKKSTKRRSRRWLWILIGILLIIILGGIGSWMGYRSGLDMRLDQEFDQIAMAAVTQFQLGLEDESAGRFEMARKRYEYVIRLDPNFPGAQERLTEVMLFMAETAVPTPVPTPTQIPVTPTPDTRGIDEKFNNAVVLMRSSDWENAITQLEFIRKEDINYRAADVDGMIYIALRFRGIQKILAGNLEPGIYDLTLSERFAPLDKDAEGYRSWARYYLTGSSFWEIDWASVVQIFGEIYPNLPNLRDGSGWTAQERFRVGSIRYAEQLAQEGNWCDARYHYQQAIALAGDEALYATATAIQLLCEPPAPTQTPTPEQSPTPSETPTLEQPLDPTETSTPEPSATQS